MPSDKVVQPNVNLGSAVTGSKPTVPVKRIVFNEITREAIQRAVANPRDIDMDLVDAQETRRILDRLYGYEVSPVLWRKVGPGLSAGRVQSAATRLVVDRERERLAFVAAGYWDLIGRFAPEASEPGAAFEARLVRLGGERVATGRDFDDGGRLKGRAVVLDVDGELAQRALLELGGEVLRLDEVTDVADRGQHLVAVAEVLGDRLHLGRRLHDDQLLRA